MIIVNNMTYELKELLYGICKLRNGNKSLFYTAFVNDMSYRQVDILAAIAIFNINTVKELTVALGINKSTVSIIAGKMVKSGLIEKSADIKDNGGIDKRRVYFYPTQKGKDIINEFFLRELSCIKDYYYSLSDEHKRYFDKGMEYIGAAFEEYRADAEKKLSEYVSLDYDKVYNAFIDIFSCFIAYKLYEFSIEDKADNDKCTFNQRHLLLCVAELKIRKITDLAEFIGYTRSAASIAVKNMVNLGFFEKERSSKDYRVFNIKLTQKGRYVVKKRNKAVLTRLGGFIDTMKESNANLFSKGIEYLSKAL